MKRAYPRETSSDEGERQAKIGALKQQLATWEESTDPDEVARVVAHFTGYGRGYSARNAKLIAAQRPDATDVAGFREWMLRGRVVRKGEHGIKILAPSKRAKAAEQAQAADAAETRTDTAQAAENSMNFVFVTVFDIAQTDPMEDGTE